MCDKSELQKEKIDAQKIATQKQEQRVQLNQYTVRKMDDESYYKDTKELSGAKHNYLRHHVRTAIIDNLGRDRYAAFDELNIKKAGDPDAEDIVLHHAVGSKHALNGEDVIEFNIAGSGFKYPAMEHKGMGGWDDTDEYRKEDIKVSWYNKIKPFTWLPGVKTEKQILELNANREETNRRIEEIYGEQVTEKVKGKTLGHLRKKQSVNDKGAQKTRFSLSGPNLINRGKYSEDNLEEYILELGKKTLQDKLMIWDWMDEEDLEKEKPVHIMVQGHSRGAVASILGAMRLKRWIADKYPRLLHKVLFDVIQYDPVAGAYDNFGMNAEVNHNPDTEALAKKDKRYMSLGEDGNTTVVYSMHTNYPVAFNPQKAIRPKRIILTMADHTANLSETDFTQKGNITRNTYFAEKNGKVEAFRSSGLGELDEGIYICDDKNNLIKLNSLEEFDAIAKPLLKGTISQSNRHDTVRSAVKAWFNNAPAAEDNAEEEKEAKPELTAEQMDEKVTDLFSMLCGQIFDDYYDEENEITMTDDIWHNIRETTNDDSITYKHFRSAIKKVKNLANKLKNGADADNRPNTEDLMDAMATLSETANIYYDNHRGHQYSDIGKKRRKVCDRVREITKEFYDRMDIANGGKGIGNITAQSNTGKYGKKDKETSESKMEELVGVYSNWKKHFTLQEGMERAKVRDRNALFRPYYRYIKLYKNTHKIKEWPKDIEEVIRTANYYRLQSEVHEKFESGKNGFKDTLVDLAKEHAQKMGQYTSGEKKLDPKEVDESLTPAQKMAIDAIDQWFLRNYNNGGIVGTMINVKNQNGEMVSELFSKTKRERLFIYYLIETKRRKCPQLYDVFAAQNYVPSLTAFKNQMLATKFKVMSRIMGSYVYMNKVTEATQVNRKYQNLIRDCAKMDMKAEEVKGEELEELKKNKEEYRTHALLKTYNSTKALREEVLRVKKLGKRATEEDKAKLNTRKNAFFDSLKELIKADEAVGEAIKYGDSLGKINADENGENGLQAVNKIYTVKNTNNQDLESNVGTYATVGTSAAQNIHLLVNAGILGADAVKDLANGVSKSITDYKIIHWNLKNNSLMQPETYGSALSAKSITALGSLLGMCCGIYNVVANWDNMHTFDKAVSITGIMASAAQTASSMVNVLETVGVVTDNMEPVAEVVSKTVGVSVAGLKAGADLYTTVTGHLDCRNQHNAAKLLSGRIYAKYYEQLKINGETPEQKQKREMEETPEQKAQRVKDFRKARYEQNMLKLSKDISEGKRKYAAIQTIASGLKVAGVYMPAVGVAGVTLGLVTSILSAVNLTEIRTKMFDRYFQFDSFIKDALEEMNKKGKKVYNLDEFKGRMRRVLAASAGYADLISACDQIAIVYATQITNGLFGAEEDRVGGNIKKAYIELIKSFGLAYDEKKKIPSPKVLARRMNGK